jgi:hypothetical protein
VVGPGKARLTEPPFPSPYRPLHLVAKAGAIGTSGRDRRDASGFQWIKWGRSISLRGRVRMLGRWYSCTRQRKRRKTHLIPLTHFGRFPSSAYVSGLPVG